MEVVLVNLGNFQEYILDAIGQLWVTGNDNITVICEENHIPRLEAFIGAFYLPIRLNIVEADALRKESFFSRECRLSFIHDHTFRDNFWNLTWDRFLMLHAYMRRDDARDVIHIENDNMVYARLGEMKDMWTSRDVWITMDSETRCVPGITYFRDATVMEEVLLKSDIMRETDMLTLAAMYHANPGRIGRLPLRPEDGDVVFDAAAIGQYLGGIDHRNTHIRDTRGYVSDGSDIKYPDYLFEWAMRDGLWRPFIRRGSGAWRPVINLHIHCKNLRAFQSWFPSETKFIPFRSSPPAPIQGEQIQKLAHMYVGEEDDLAFNPLIREETIRHFPLSVLYRRGSIWNPPVIFVYTIRIVEFVREIGDKLLRPCIILCHNSDFNITDDVIDSLRPFLARTPIRCIYTQNLCSLLDRDLWKPLPIGIQNNQWLSSPFPDLSILHSKNRGTYMNFSIHTNPPRRQEALDVLRHRIPWVETQPQVSYWNMLSSYRRSVCPEGNGADTHRVWESLYMQCRPIVLHSVFIHRLLLEFPQLRASIECLERWEDITPNETSTSFDPVSGSAPSMDFIIRYLKA